MPRDRQCGSSWRAPGLLSAACLLFAGCASEPLVPYDTVTPAMALFPAAASGVIDQRARFREIFCAVLGSHGEDLPDYRPCEQALTRVGTEDVAPRRPVSLAPSRRHLVAALVPGVGYECFEPWLEPPGTSAKHLRTQGYDMTAIKVDALSGSANNARQVRDALMAMPLEDGAPRVVLIGYSKGAPDVLEALVEYPEIRSRIAAVVSAAGAVGGSPLANDFEQKNADLMRHFPKANCGPGDGGAVESLRPHVRRAWLAGNQLPAEVPYYSIVTLPEPQRISGILKSSYRKLAQVDGRNDSQVIYYDQVIPASTLLGYLNADHWAIALPISRSHSGTAKLFVTQNAYPREALLEALMRFIEEDLDARASPAK